MRQVFLDTETTGLNAADGDRIVEIGCVEAIDRQLTGRNLHFYLNPERASDPDALKVHGLTCEFLADKPTFAEISDEVLEYLDGAEIVIHNAGFDVAFLNKELRRAGRGPLAPLGHPAGLVITDSLVLARELFPGKANSLDALCRRLEVDNSKRNMHGALLDAGLLAEAYIRMTREQKSLVMNGADSGESGRPAVHAPLMASSLPVIYATDDELTSHALVVAEVEKASGGKAVWRIPAASSTTSIGSATCLPSTVMS